MHSTRQVCMRSHNGQLQALAPALHDVRGDISQGPVVALLCMHVFFLCTGKLHAPHDLLCLSVTLAGPHWHLESFCTIIKPLPACLD